MSDVVIGHDDGVQDRGLALPAMDLDLRSKRLNLQDRERIAQPIGQILIRSLHPKPPWAAIIHMRVCKRLRDPSGMTRAVRISVEKLLGVGANPHRDGEIRSSTTPARRKSWGT